MVATADRAVDIAQRTARRRDWIAHDRLSDLGNRRISFRESFAPFVNSTQVYSL